MKRLTAKDALNMPYFHESSVTVKGIESVCAAQKCEKKVNAKSSDASNNVADHNNASNKRKKG